MDVLASPTLPSRPSILESCAIRFSAAASAKRLRTSRRTSVELGASPLNESPMSTPAWLAPAYKNATSRGIPADRPVANDDW